MRRAGSSPARCSPSPASTAPAARAASSTTWARPARCSSAGAGPVRHVRLPGNTLQIRGQAVCASIRGVPFEPCFNLDKKDERSFRGSVSGMGFAYCDFRHQGAAQMLMARAVARPRSLRSRRTGPARCRSVRARGDRRMSRARRIEPVKSEARSEPAKAESASGAAPLDRLIGRRTSKDTLFSAYTPGCATGTAAGVCLRNRMRW